MTSRLENQSEHKNLASGLPVHTITELEQISSWEDRYKKIIALGKALPPLAEQYKTSKWLVKGCQSQVWLTAYLKNGRVVFCSDSDALITKGLTALLVRHYSYRTPEDILKDKIPCFFKTLNLQNHLTPTRVGGLFSMLKQIHYYAQSFFLISKHTS